MKESKPETRLQIVGPGHGAVSLEANGGPVFPSLGVVICHAYSNCA